ncbi:MAG: DUF1592 domain-containing protein, partial [Planctomycetaceae bacterium]
MSRLFFKPPSGPPGRPASRPDICHQTHFGEPVYSTNQQFEVPTDVHAHHGRTVRQHGTRRATVYRLAILVLLSGFPSTYMHAADPKSLTFRETIRPILEQFCFGCHGPKTQKANLRLDTLAFDLSRARDAETWQDVLDKLNLGEMPPKLSRQPAATQRRQLVNGLTTQLRLAERQRRSTGGRVVMRRLTRYEYNITMRELLGINLNFAENLPPESLSPEGFQNNGGTLGISPLQIEYYLQAARLGLAKAITTGSQPQVVHHHAEKSEKIRRVKGEVSNRLKPRAKFLMRLQEFPREGEVRIRVRASAVVPESSGVPHMRVTMGVRADVRAPEQTLGEADVRQTTPQTFTFRGRIEQFPLPGHNPKYPGLQITIYNAYEDGKPAKQKKGRKKDQTTVPVDPTDPLIVIHSVDFDGPVHAEWPPRSHTRIFLPPLPGEAERTYAQRILARFMTRAYRRPIRDTDLTAMLSLYDTLRPTAKSFESAMRDVLAMVLISPDFLYLIEPRTDSRQPQELNDFELAARLSYFLWSSMPDKRLFQLATAGSLTEHRVLANEVRRMIGDSKSNMFVENFTDQWLGLAGLDRVAVNPEFYPKFDNRLKQDMRT